MRILGLETSGQRAGVALLDEGAVAAAAEIQAAGRTGERILDLVDALLEALEWELTGIDRIAVDAGPGSFTGLRVGLGLAKGLSLGAGAGVVAVSSLDVLARQAGGEGPVLAAMNAPRGMVYGGLFIGEAAQPAVAEAAWEPALLWDAVVAALAGRPLGPIRVVGPGAIQLGPGAPAFGRGVSFHGDERPAAEWVARRASRSDARVLDEAQLARLEPRYLRGADVRRPKDRTRTLPSP